MNSDHVSCQEILPNGFNGLIFKEICMFNDKNALLRTLYIAERRTFLRKNISVHISSTKEGGGGGDQPPPG